MTVRLHVRQISCKLLSYTTTYCKMKCKREKVGDDEKKEHGKRKVFLSISRQN